MAIHSRSEIDPTARIADDCGIGPGVVIGPNSIIETGAEIGPNVVIGPNSIVETGAEIGPNVVIGSFTTIREGARIYPGAVIGMEPQDFKFDGSPTTCEIGKRTLVRECCTINRGTNASGATIVGEDCMLMSYSHIAHDNRIGNHVTMASGVLLGGHCEIGDHAVLGGNAALHQFLRVGKLAMVGGMAGLRQDAPPFMITAGHPPAVVYGVNMIGLKRNGTSDETRKIIKNAFRILYRSGLNRSDGLAKIKEEVEQIPEIAHLLEFFNGSRRGVARGSSTRSEEQ